MTCRDSDLRSYLPLVDEGHLRDLLFSDDWSGMEGVLANADFERLGLDRSLRIATDIIDTYGSLEGMSILDVGCNTGVISHLFAMLGAAVTGVDSRHVDGQSLYEKLAFIPTRMHAVKYEVQDLLTFLSDWSWKCDVALLLSVIHHWPTGYAQSGNAIYSKDQIAWIADKLMTSTRRAVYLELPIDEPGYEAGSAMLMAEPFMAHAAAIEDRGLTIGPNGYLRRMLRLETR